MFSNNTLGIRPKYDFLWDRFLEKRLKEKSITGGIWRVLFERYVYFMYKLIVMNKLIEWTFIVEIYHFKEQSHWTE